MSIRFQLLLFVVLGNLLIASVFLFSSTYREDIQETSAGDSLVVLYESAWFQTYNTTFERMSRWLPNIGENGEQEVPHLHFHIFGGEKVGKMVS